MQKRGATIKSERPVEVVASTMRASITRGQNIFTKDGTKFGLVEWQKPCVKNERPRLATRPFGWSERCQSRQWARF